jgi:hypothetical protein
MFLKFSLLLSFLVSFSSFATIELDRHSEINKNYAKKK